MGEQGDSTDELSAPNLAQVADAFPTPSFNSVYLPQWEAGKVWDRQIDIDGTADKVLQGDHPQPFYHGEYAALDVLILVRRNSCLEVGHLALQASLRDLDVLPQLVSF